MATRDDTGKIVAYGGQLQQDARLTEQQAKIDEMAAAGNTPVAPAQGVNTTEADTIPPADPNDPTIAPVVTNATVTSTTTQTPTGYSTQTRVSGQISGYSPQRDTDYAAARGILEGNAGGRSSGMAIRSMETNMTVLKTAGYPVENLNPEQLASLGGNGSARIMQGLLQTVRTNDGGREM
jgi:hypothetical protein